MEYPLLVDGKRAGTLDVREDGLFTVFDAHCEKKTGILKISVYGGGMEGYLGIMQPGHDGLYLRRRFSKAQMKDFPPKIEYAAPAGTKIKSECKKSVQTQGLYWYRYSDGSLICRDGSGFIIALPARLKKPAPGAVLREIDGQLYMLFRY